VTASSTLTSFEVKFSVTAVTYTILIA
jgi:hypothetical protein